MATAIISFYYQQSDVQSNIAEVAAIIGAIKFWTDLVQLLITNC